jgi:BMFP domain-containing protein YqiC
MTSARNAAQAAVGSLSNQRLWADWTIELDFEATTSLIGHDLRVAREENAAFTARVAELEATIVGLQAKSDEWRDKCTRLECTLLADRGDAWARTKAENAAMRARVAELEGLGEWVGNPELDRLHKGQLQAKNAALTARAKQAEREELRRFWSDLSEWSQATFGHDCVRGPIGPLKHLALEVAECQESPFDVEEYADCVFLIFDACRRAGFTFDHLRDAIWKKLAKNKARQWGPPSETEPTMHIPKPPPEPMTMPSERPTSRPAEAQRAMDIARGKAFKRAAIQAAEKGE